MTDKTLERSQSDMRKRWSDPTYRLLHGSVNGAVPTTEFTLNTLTLTPAELWRKLEETYHTYDRNKQTVS